MKKTQVFRTAVGVVATASVLMTGSAFAAPKDFKKFDAKSNRGFEQRAKTPEADHVLGKVTGLNGTSFTIIKPGMRNGAAEVSYTVNTSATTMFKKDGKAAVFSDLAVGAIVKVNGTINKETSTIVATAVNMSAEQKLAQKKDREKKHLEKKLEKRGFEKSLEVREKHGKNKPTIAPVSAT